MQDSIHVYETHQQASFAAAAAVAAELRRLITDHSRAIGIFSGEASQAELLGHLANAEAIEWTRVIGFHTAECLGAREDAPRSHRKFLFDRLVCRVPMAEFHGIRGDAANPEAVCANYATLFQSRRPDLALLGIGPSGELEAIRAKDCDFNDSLPVKITESCIALTIPTLMACSSLFVIATDKEKRQAVQTVIEGSITETYPASILQNHPNVHWYLDKEAAANLSQII